MIEDTIRQDPSKISPHHRHQSSDPAGLVLESHSLWCSFYSLISPCITAEHGLGSRLDSQSISSQFNRNIYNCVTLEMENKVGESFVETKNCFFKLSFYPHKIPETCRWLIEKVIILIKKKILSDGAFLLACKKSQSVLTVVFLG